MHPQRQQLIDDRQLAGTALCRALSEVTDRWLASLFETTVDEPHGVALVAVGGYGRGELSPRSDLDLLLVHDDRPDIAAVAEALWYPIWDAGEKLGHAVRTVAEAVKLADTDLDTATSLLDCRHLAGDPALTERLKDAALDRWRKRAKRWLAELSTSVRKRHQERGEVAFLLEPHLKEGRGGLRDVHALRWAQVARTVLLDDDDDTLGTHYSTLLAARVELHRVTGRVGDVLRLEEQDAVATALGYDDADALMLALATAARAVAWRSDDTWRRVDSSLSGPLGRLVLRDRKLGAGLVARDGSVIVTPDADLSDPVLPLRAAAVAATAGLAIDRSGLARLREVPPLPEPWPGEARDRLVELLLAGRSAIAVIEALDHHGLWTAVLPEWEQVHSKPQRNAYHRFTVDRHLLEAAANAAELAERVDRPDLLVVGALMHDIGKGRPGDHTEVGIDMVSVIGARMGFDPDDVDDLVQMVRHHLLLPDVATRRDLSDEGTLASVAAAVGSVRVLRLLDALTEADSLATGPAAWGEWKAGLVRQLVQATAHLLAGGDLAEILPPGFPTPADHALLAGGRRHVVAEGNFLTVVDTDRPGLFAAGAGVLAVNGLAVVAASAWSDQGRAIARFEVATEEVDTDDGSRWQRVEADLAAAIDGDLDIDDRLAQRARYTRPVRFRSAHAPERTRVVVDNEASRAATVVEVHSPDRPGVLYRITRVLAELGLDIRTARVQTLGAMVVDSFYLLDRDGKKLLDEIAQETLRSAVLTALAP